MLKWKYDGSFVYIKHIEEICEFLDIKPNFLFFDSADEEEWLLPSEKDMIQMYRNLDDGRKACIRDKLKYSKKIRNIGTKSVW